jgi:DNA-binding XRE family transcriptional regulator
MSGMSNPTSGDLAKLGYRVVMSGELGDLRRKVGISRNAQARLIGVDEDSLPKWESLRRAMNIETAVRIGEWFWAAERAIEDIEPIDFTRLIPAARAAQHFGIRAEEVDKVIKQRNLRHESLGVLGLFIYRSEFTARVDA